MGTDTSSTSSPSTFGPSSTLGILGGGQLGRMLSLAAARLGIHCHAYAPEAGGPAAQVTPRHTQGAWDDADALSRFADVCDVVTYEWENVPLAAARAVVASRTPLRPGLRALQTAQDRLLEKEFLNALPGVRVAPFRAVEAGSDIHTLRRAVQYVGGLTGGESGGAVIKTRRGGYDGKGQAVVRSEADLAGALEALGDRDLVVEGFVDFSREVSVVAARGVDGTVAAYPAAENHHEGGILRRSVAPAQGDTSAAEPVVARILEALDYVGTIGVEFFDTPQGLVVNEFAPRVHNSGHWTQDAGCMDQFELHVRAVMGWPLQAVVGDVRPRLAVQMDNLLGADAGRWAELPGDARLHLYGKREARPGRKMGHVNRVLGRLV